MADWPGNRATSALGQSLDWSKTSLGPIEEWSPSLKSFVDFVRDSQQPMYVAAGPELQLIYNDAYIDFLDGKHPQAFGAPFKATFAEIYEQLEPMLTKVLAGHQQIMLDQHFTLPWRKDAPEGWFTATWTPIRGERREFIGFLAAISETTDEHIRQNQVHDSEVRQAFLLNLGDTLRHLSNATDILQEASRLLRHHLSAGRVTYWQYVADDVVEGTVEDVEEGWPSFIGNRFSYQAFEPEGTELYRRNRPVWRNDVQTASDLPDEQKTAFAATFTRAFLNVSLVKDDKLILCLVVYYNESHAWTDAEVQLVEEVAARTWAVVERVLAEASLRASEARLRQFGRASSDGLWIRDAATLQLEYASNAMETIYGISIASLTADPLAWPALIVPEDREETFGYIERMKAGESVAHEFRIQRPTDLQFRWIRSVGFPLVDEKGGASRIAGISSDFTEEKMLAEHQGVLLHELQHRVRNIMGMIRSVGNRSASGATSVEHYRQTLEGRMLALARVQALLTREANAGGSLRSIIESEVKVQAHHPHQFELAGPDIMLSPKAVEVLTLAFHELSTNALKYGAFSIPDGKLTVSWSTFEKRGAPWLGIDWVEAGTPPREPSTRRGFGSELIEARIPYELGGSGKVSIESGGARCRIEFPLMNAESILETDAPMPTTTFGGATDMSGAPDLAGRTVLVVEDDYYTAADTVAALRGAGADVLGPCPSEDATRELLEKQLPTHAVLDLNLGGGGPKFGIAQLLKAKGVPFVFITGYDPDIIPTELVDVPRLQKPVPFRSVVDAVSQLPGDRPQEQ